MAKQLYLAKPVLKAADVDHLHGSYIYFDEWVDIPGLERANISIRFERENSFEDMQALARQLKRMGFTFAVEK